MVSSVLPAYSAETAEPPHKAIYPMWVHWRLKVVKPIYILGPYYPEDDKSTNIRPLFRVRQTSFTFNTIVKPSDDAFSLYHWCQCKKTFDGYERRSVGGCVQLTRWFIGDFTLTPQYFASSLSVNCHDSQIHRLPTISLHRVCQYTVTTVSFTVYRPWSLHRVCISSTYCR